MSLLFLAYVYTIIDEEARTLMSAEENRKEKDTMPQTDTKKNKIAYIRGYNKSHYRSVNVMFRVDSPEDMAIWDFIHSKWSTAGFLRDLARKAMEAEKKEGK